MRARIPRASRLRGARRVRRRRLRPREERGGVVGPAPPRGRRTGGGGELPLGQGRGPGGRVWGERPSRDIHRDVPRRRRRPDARLGQDAADDVRGRGRVPRRVRRRAPLVPGGWEARGVRRQAAPRRSSRVGARGAERVPSRVLPGERVARIQAARDRTVSRLGVGAARAAFAALDGGLARRSRRARATGRERVRGDGRLESRR